MRRRLAKAWSALRGSSLYFRIFITTSVVMALTLSVSLIVTLRIFSDTMEDKAEQELGNILEQTNKLIEQRIGMYVNTSQLIFNDPTLLSLPELSDQRRGNDPAFNKEVEPVINKYALSDPGILSVFLVNGRDKRFFPSADFDYYSSGVTDYIEHYYGYAEEYFTRGIVWIPTHPIDYDSRSYADGKVLKLVRDLYDLGVNYSSTLIINVKESSLYELFDNIHTPSGTEFYVLDESGHVITGTDRTAVGGRADEGLFSSAIRAFSGSFQADYRGEPSLYVFQRLEDVEWTTVGIAPIRELLKDRNDIVSGVRLVVLGLLLVSILAAWLLAYSITKPIRGLTGKMQQVKGGNFDVQMDIRSKDEIGLLSLTFNKMVTRINELMNQLKISHRKERDAEMRALQANINPHFLYNTLESVIWLAESRDYDGVTRIISRLGRYYRLSLSRGMDIVKIRDEVAHAENYLSIVRMRYGDKFKYAFDVDPAIAEEPCLKLILQPLVENSLHHGIFPKDGQGTVTVLGERDGAGIRLIVVDDGIGIPPARLNEINAAFRTGHSRELTGSYGIKNVNERIQLKHGAEYGLYFESEEGVGTRVVVRLPAG
ncbi:sensor histidine kinase [Cohnella hongkongensis]|uniref:histidine kinase n=1 Tax=Cohnella hongkongensis TaxID=178337 RepID=A0ABV9F8X0_9BACL